MKIDYNIKFLLLLGIHMSILIVGIFLLMDFFIIQYLDIGFSSVLGFLCIGLSMVGYLLIIFTRVCDDFDI